MGILDSAGTLVVEYHYDAWGESFEPTGTLVTTLGTKNPFRYRGYVYDEETGYYYLRSRYYDPELRRFIRADPLIDRGTFDKGAGLFSYTLFAYCANDPIDYSDPSGLKLKLTGTFLEKLKMVFMLAKLYTSPTGKELIDTIVDSEKTCTIKIVSIGANYTHPDSGGDALNGIGSDVTVAFDPNFDPDIYTLNPTTGAGNYTKRPGYIGLGHELIHAYRNMDGTSVYPGKVVSYSYVDEKGIQQMADASLDELQTVGIITDETTIFTENMLRSDLGLEIRIKY